MMRLRRKKSRSGKLRAKAIAPLPRSTNVFPLGSRQKNPRVRDAQFFPFVAARVPAGILPSTYEGFHSGPAQESARERRTTPSSVTRIVHGCASVQLSPSDLSRSLAPGPGFTPGRAPWPLDRSGHQFSHSVRESAGMSRTSCRRKPSSTPLGLGGAKTGNPSGSRERTAGFDQISP